VTFEQFFEAEDSLKLVELPLNGNTLIIEPVRIKQKSKSNRKEKFEVFVGGFPLNVTKEDLEEKFKECGEIEAISLPPFDHKGFSFILFKTKEACDKAILLNGTEWKSTTLNINMSYEKRLKQTKFQRDLAKRLKKLTKVNPDDHVDEVRLGDESGEGWKKRYYQRNFENIEIGDVAECYIEGLCWVSKYYFQGNVSWSWYYKYNYSPFASDLVGCDKIQVNFTLSEPFKPFTQLLAILPAKSSHALPKSYQSLMTSKDSPIIDFYPDDFKVDLVGKKVEYKGVVLLPFIDAERLLKEVEKIENDLTKDELKRNSFGNNFLFVNQKNFMAKTLTDKWTKIDPQLSDNLFGKVKPFDFIVNLKSPFVELLQYHPDVKNNQTLMLEYVYPKYDKHICDLLPGVDLKNAELSPSSPFMFSFPLGEFSPTNGPTPLSSNKEMDFEVQLKDRTSQDKSDLEKRITKLESELEKEKEERLSLENLMNQQEILFNRRLDKMQKIIDKISKSLEE
jgi:RNA recognition motif-containing protein